MFQRDYLLKIIEEMSLFLAQVIKQRKEKNYTRAQELIDEAYTSMLKIDRESVKNKSLPEICKLLENNNRNDVKLIEILSKLLYEEALLNKDKDKDQQKALFKKSLELLKYADENDTKNFSFERKQQLDKLLKAIN